MNKSYNWNNLTPLQLGKCAEYFVKFEFMYHGFDVYSSEVDEHGIDLIARNNTEVYDVQVKSVRNLNYIFFLKDKFIPDKKLLAAIVLFLDGELPRLYLIPSLTWLKPNRLLVSRDYEGKKSNPEWGLVLSPKNLPQLDDFSFEKIVVQL